MSSNLPTVSVVIPARDAAATLPRALQSVAAQDYPNIVEVIVAAADDRTAEAAGKDVIVIPNPDGSTPAGLNRAIEASSGDVIVRCDTQAVLASDYVSKAIDTMERTGAENVGGMQVPSGETPWEKAISAAMSHRLGAGDARYRIGGEEGPVETVYLGVLRRDTVERLGGFDETFQRTQDYELNHRIIESGGIVWFTPAMKTSYTPRGSLSELARQYYRYGQAKRKFRRKHRGSLRWRQWAPPTLVIAVSASVLASVWLPYLAAIPIVYAAGVLSAGFVSSYPSVKTGLALSVMHAYWGLGFLVGDR